MEVRAQKKTRREAGIEEAGNRPGNDQGRLRLQEHGGRLLKYRGRMDP